MNLPMVGTTMAGHIHIMIIEHIMKLDIILKIIGCVVRKMPDQTSFYLGLLIILPNATASSGFHQIAFKCLLTLSVRCIMKLNS